MPTPPDFSDSLRDEFNRWAEEGRGEGMEQEHLPIVLPMLDRMGLAPDDNVLDVGERIPDATVWTGPNRRASLRELVSEGRVLLLFYLFDWSST